MVLRKSLLTYWHTLLIMHPRFIFSYSVKEFTFIFHFYLFEGEFCFLIRKLRCFFTYDLLLLLLFDRKQIIIIIFF